MGDGIQQQTVVSMGREEGEHSDELREASEEATARQQQLATIFEEVTGHVAFVEEQDPGPTLRCLDDEETSSVSEYVTAVAKEDGLDDTIDTETTVMNPALPPGEFE